MIIVYHVEKRSPIRRNSICIGAVLASIVVLILSVAIAAAFKFYPSGEYIIVRVTEMQNFIIILS